ncbi:hypothetical protein AYO20_01415 [Fonsecaea nubica]|uniref:Mg2+ transporter protein, CorA-like/Zinc transport protein ZntB n=1 Tax=Fonsecaea nubica TaxID=856822 RepID=A0A178DBR1_9EURO|nr:hypothetical protein AYO20_01415 [Fonsecaea nubica]OAL39097.1 hypothetical protein AYO20_01415 [Fonsecaea nubica]
MRDKGGSQGLALNKNNKIESDGPRSSIPGISSGRLAAVRSRLRSREVTERKQVGDAESMINEEPSVVQPGGAKYVLRTESCLPNDLTLAVSWRWSGDGGSTQAFLHGCSSKHDQDAATASTEDCDEADTIRQWLDGIPAGKSLGLWRHPLLPALLLGEMQLTRHADRFESLNRKFSQVFHDIQIAARQPHLADHWTNRQVSKWLQDICDMFEYHHKFRRIIVLFIEILETLLKLCGEANITGTSKAHQDFRIASESIACRFRGLLQNYSALEGQAQFLIDGTSLLQETLWGVTAQNNSQINTKISNTSRAIAKAASQDSSAMKALAVITAIFLPSTAIATVFALPIIDWTKQEAFPHIRKSIWIYVVTCLVLTGTTLYFWRFWHLRDLWKRDVNSKADEISANKTESRTKPQQAGGDTSEYDGANQGQVVDTQALLSKGNRAKEDRERVLGEAKRQWPYPLKQLLRLKRHYQQPDEESVLVITRSEDSAPSDQGQTHNANRESSGVHDEADQTSDKKEASRDDQRHRIGDSSRKPQSPRKSTATPAPPPQKPEPSSLTTSPGKPSSQATPSTTFTAEQPTASELRTPETSNSSETRPSTVSTPTDGPTLVTKPSTEEADSSTAASTTGQATTTAASLQQGSSCSDGQSINK